MTTNELSIVELDYRAVRQSIHIVEQIQPPDLARPTPCAGWSLGDLLRHMTVQHHGFAAAGEGNGLDPANWRLSDADAAADPAEAYVRAAHRVTHVFQSKDILSQRFQLPEFSPTVEFLAAQAIGFHFIDYVVHGWDVARSIGQDYILDEELALAALKSALAVPNGSERLADSAAFAPGLAYSPQLSPLEQILRALGRDPAWPGSGSDSGSDSGSGETASTVA